MTYSELKALTGETINGKTILKVERGMAPNTVNVTVRFPAGHTGVVGRHAFDEMVTFNNESQRAYFAARREMQHA
jgi:hypothetical protein